MFHKHAPFLPALDRERHTDYLECRLKQPLHATSVSDPMLLESSHTVTSRQASSPAPAGLAPTGYERRGGRGIGVLEPHAD